MSKLEKAQDSPSRRLPLVLTFGGLLFMSLMLNGLAPKEVFILFCNALVGIGFAVMTISAITGLSMLAYAVSEGRHKFSFLEFSGMSICIGAIFLAVGLLSFLLEGSLSSWLGST